MPAVSSNSARRSVGLDERIASIWPCETIAYEPGPEARAHQQLVHVAQPHRLAVDVELRLAGAIRAARDLHFAEVERQHAIAVVERQRDFGHAERLARVVAGEDDVFHLLRAQAARRLLAEHPADRIDEIRFARTVRADDRGGAVDEIERRRFGERLEAEDFERFESHGVRRALRGRACGENGDGDACRARSPGRRLSTPAAAGASRMPRAAASRAPSRRRSAARPSSTGRCPRPGSRRRRAPARCSGGRCGGPFGALEVQRRQAQRALRELLQVGLRVALADVARGRSARGAPSRGSARRARDPSRRTARRGTPRTRRRASLSLPAAAAALHPLRRARSSSREAEPARGLARTRRRSPSRALRRVSAPSDGFGILRASASATRRSREPRRRRTRAARSTCRALFAPGAVVHERLLDRSDVDIRGARNLRAARAIARAASRRPSRQLVSCRRRPSCCGRRNRSRSTSRRRPALCARRSARSRACTRDRGLRS